MEEAAPIGNLPRPKGTLLRFRPEEKWRLRVRSMVPADSSAPRQALPSPDVSRRSPILAAKSGEASRSAVPAKCLPPRPSGFSPGFQWWSNNPLNWSRRDPGGSSSLGGFGEAHRFGDAHLTKPGGPVSLIVGLNRRTRYRIGRTKMLEIHMVPVTNGESTLIRLCDEGEEVAILIDGGLSSSECNTYLQSLGISKLDVVVASHFHWDHVGGLESIRNDIEISEYWTGDLRPFEDYCRRPSSPYVLACLATADGPLRSSNGKNRLVWDGIQKSFAGGKLTLEVIAPPYDLWKHLRRPGVAAGLLRPSQENAYRKRLLDYPEALEIEDEIEERSGPDGEWETAQAIGVQRFPETTRITEDSIDQIEELKIAEYLASAISPWNDMSIVVKATYQSQVGSQSVLFPGDLTNWSYIYAHHAGDARCDLLKIPHHCSDTYIDRDDVDNFINGEWRFLARGLDQHGPSWLDRQLRSRIKRKGSPYYEWYKYWRRYGPFLPIFPFPSVPFTHTAFGCLPSDILDWLQPAEAFYFPFQHGHFKLPAWNKRERVRSKVAQLHCTRGTCGTVKGSGLATSCREHSGCKMRKQPKIFRWD